MNTKNNNKSTTATTEAVRPGRPKYAPKFPRTNKWTMADFMEVNGVNPETGKGENCAKLTLIQFRNRDVKLGEKSVIVKLDELRAPASVGGLGRRAFVYCLRSKLDEIQAADAAKAAKVKPAKVKPAKVAKSTTVPVASVKPTKAKTVKITKVKPAPATVDVGTAAETPEVAPVAEVPSAYELQKAALLAPTVIPDAAPEVAPVPVETVPAN